MDNQICARCGCEQKQDIRTWTYMKAIDRHLCPVCVFEGGKEESPQNWAQGGDVDVR